MMCAQLMGAPAAAYIAARCRPLSKPLPALTFLHLDQFLGMAFAQLTIRKRLRDIETCQRAHSSTLYHLGIRGRIARGTLADANQKRYWRIARDLAVSLIQTRCRRGLRRRDQAHRLAARHHDDRSVEVAGSMGALSQGQGRRNVAHPARSVGAPLQAESSGQSDGTTPALNPENRGLLRGHLLLTAQ